MKRFFWTVFLPHGWYFITLVDEYPMARPAYWNGVIWETRIEIIEDWRVWKIVGRVPSPHCGVNT